MKIIQIATEDRRIFGLGDDNKIYNWRRENGGIWEGWWNKDQQPEQGEVSPILKDNPEVI